MQTIIIEMSVMVPTSPMWRLKDLLPQLQGKIHEGDFFTVERTYRVLRDNPDKKDAARASAEYLESIAGIEYEAGSKGRFFLEAAIKLLYEIGN